MQGDGHPPTPATGDRAIDLALAVAVGVLTTTGSFGSSDFFGPTLVGIDDLYPPPAIGLPLAAVAVLAAWKRRRAPLLFLVVALATNTVVSAQLVVMFALYTLAERTLSWKLTAIATAVATTLVGIPIWRHAGLDGAVPLAAACCVAPALLGLYVGTRRALIERMRERAERAEREQQQRVAQARSDERARIARDMHDVVTHRVASMVLHATALEATGGANGVERGREIGAIGRDALAELRALVGVLRNDDDVPIAPQPGLDDLDALIESSRLLGLPVTIETVNDCRVAPSLLAEHAVYRVVQEALTNVHKHAPGARTHVRIHQTRDRLDITVTNGRGSSAPSTDLPDSGYGLLGIAERIRLLGGELTTGNRPDGGYDLRARIPLRSDDA